MRVLHLLSQQPAYTGSGVALHEVVDQARRQGIEQRVLVGLPAEAAVPQVGGLTHEDVYALRFGGEELPFALPGMSDVMPYKSSRFAQLTSPQLESYRQAWRACVIQILRDWQPDLIQSNHIWLLSATVAELRGSIPLVIYSHATGLRQLVLCPHLAEEVIHGCRKANAWLVLHDEQRRQVAQTLNVPLEEVQVAGTGYSDRIFHSEGRCDTSTGRMLYVGKYSRAKGLPELLDAIERLPGKWELHIAGAGAGEEAETLAARTEQMPNVIQHGQLAQSELAGLMRQSDLLVLPSFYEGLPLVLAEARACGCRLVATGLPGIRQGLAPWLGDSLHLVTQPPMASVDEPVGEYRSVFVSELCNTLAHAMSLGPAGSAGAELVERFGWSALAGRMIAIWRRVARDTR